jgi:cytoskeletal protein CcmA (bactofilin family)
LLTTSATLREQFKQLRLNIWQQRLGVLLRIATGFVGLIVAARSAAPKQPARSGSVTSIINSDVVVNGTLTSTGEIQIDGRVDGDVRSVRLVVGDSGQIYGEILAGDVTIRGHVKGRIRARKVLFCAGSHVEGEILHQTFVVEPGAFLEGNCRHSETHHGSSGNKNIDVSRTRHCADPASGRRQQPAGLSGRTAASGAWFCAAQDQQLTKGRLRSALSS